MKFKSLITALLLSVFLAGSAYALPWSWDLSGVGPNGVEAKVQLLPQSSTVNFNDFMGVVNGGIVGFSEINQSLGANGILGNGDTFTELGFLSHVNVDNRSISFYDSLTGDEYVGYFKFSDLSGYITNYSANAGGDTSLANLAAVADDEFDLVFNPGSGTIAFYIDDDFDDSNGTIAKLADFTLLAGEGTSPELAVGGALEGTFGLVVGFTNVMSDVWSFAGGDFEDWLATYGASSISLSSFNLGATVKAITPSAGGDGNGNDAILFDIFNHGDFSLSAVPEPTTMVLFGIGLLGLAGVTRRKIS